MIRQLLFASAVLALLAPSPASADDEVFGSTGTPLRGSIQSVSPVEVVLQTASGERRIAVNQIRKLGFDQDTGEIRTARERALRGQYEDALAALEQLNPAQIQRDLLKQDVQFYVAFCKGKIALNSGGDKREAGAAMRAFLTQNPKSYHFVEGTQMFADLAMSMGAYAMAAEWYGRLEAAPWPDVKLGAQVQVANALIADNKFAEAAAKYDAVLASALDTPEVSRQKRFAEVGKAYCLSEAGDPAQGVAMIEKIIQENDPQDIELFARAYNALGNAHLKAGRKKEALHAFLHTDVLFFGVPDAHAEALHHLATLWREQNKADRALRCTSLLQTRYAGTKWAP